jgi:SAM-dependent methyltransferase
MDSLAPSGPNADQIRYWNETGSKWVHLHDRINAQITRLGELAIERADPRERERVMDVGCGCGTTTLALAGAVGASGHVVGIDLSAVMLERAQQAARDAGVPNVEFVNADAQTHRFSGPPFDLVYSRFGIMFFANPAAAFANLRHALRPGGRLTFVCWRPLLENPWMLVPLMAAAQHIQLTPPAPDAPGPFAFGDPERVRSILENAGFRDLTFEDIDAMLTVGGGGSLADTVEFLMQMGPTGAALRDADPDVQPRVAAAISSALEPYHTPEGVRMAGAARIVRARTDQPQCRSVEEVSASSHPSIRRLRNGAYSG